MRPNYMKNSKIFLLAFMLLTGLAAGQNTPDTFVVDADTHIDLLEDFDAELLYTVPQSRGS